MKVLYLKDKFIYIYEDGRVVRQEYKPFKTKDYVTSILPYSSTISFNFKLTEDDEDLIVKAEDYVYRESALNLDKEYKINYFFNKDELKDFYYVEAAIVEVEVLEELFSKFVKDFGYIDYIGFSPAVFEEYYNISGDEKGNDLFVYFDQNDSFISFVKNGNFMFSKALSKFSLLKNYMQSDDEIIIEALKEEGIVDLEKAMTENINVQYPMIAQFFEEYFTKLMHIVSQTVNYYKLDKIDNIFFYSPFEIKYIEEFFHKKYGEETNFKLYTIDSDYDPFDITAIHYNVKHLEDENTNFSIFLRPPPFYKTTLGQFSIFMASGLLLLSLDAGYKLYEINSYEKEFLTYKRIYEKKKKEIKFYQLAIKKYDNKISKLRKNILEYKKKIDEYYKELKYLDSIDSAKPFFNNLVVLDVLYKRYNLTLVSFSKNGNNYAVTLKSSDKNGNSIALFMKDLLKNHFKNVSSKEISKTDTNYVAEVKFDE